MAILQSQSSALTAAACPQRSGAAVSLYCARATQLSIGKLRYRCLQLGTIISAWWSEHCWRTFAVHTDGFLVVRRVAPLADVQRIKHRMGELARGEGFVPMWPPGEQELTFKFAGAAEQQRREKNPGQQKTGGAQGPLLRMHMLHRVDPTMEDAMLHPRVLDVLECLVGPDVACLQSMAFFNPPGQGGQGWHQDSAYITTYPDTLIGSWLALDRADTETGCLYVARGSNAEPIYPETLPDGSQRGNLVHAQGVFTQLPSIRNSSHLDNTVNTLSDIAAKYGEPVPVEVDPGDCK